MCYKCVNANYFVMCVNDEIKCVNMLLDDILDRYSDVNAHDYQDLHILKVYVKPALTA